MPNQQHEVRTPSSDPSHRSQCSHTSPQKIQPLQQCADFLKRKFQKFRNLLKKSRNPTLTEKNIIQRIF